MQKTIVAIGVALFMSNALATGGGHQPPPKPNQGGNSTANAAAHSNASSNSSSYSGSSSNSSSTNNVSGGNSSSNAAGGAGGNGGMGGSSSAVGQGGTGGVGQGGAGGSAAGGTGQGGTSSATGGTAAGGDASGANNANMQGGSTSIRALNVQLPNAVNTASVPIALNACVISESRGAAIGWNFASATRAGQRISPSCVLSQLALAHEASCQHASAYRMRVAAMTVLPSEVMQSYTEEKIADVIERAQGIHPPAGVVDTGPMACREPVVVERTVTVPGPERIVDRVVTVPGPERIVNVPSPARVVTVYRDRPVELRQAEVYVPVDPRNVIVAPTVTAPRRSVNLCDPCQAPK